MNLSEFRRDLDIVKGGQSSTKSLMESVCGHYLPYTLTEEQQLENDVAELQILLFEYERIANQEKIQLFEAPEDEPRQLSGKEIEQLFTKVSLAANQKKQTGEVGDVSDESQKGGLQKKIEAKLAKILDAAGLKVQKGITDKAKEDPEGFLEHVKNMRIKLDEKGKKLREKLGGRSADGEGNEAASIIGKLLAFADNHPIMTPVIMAAMTALIGISVGGFMPAAAIALGLKAVMFWLNGKSGKALLTLTISAITGGIGAELAGDVADVGGAEAGDVADVGNDSRIYQGQDPDERVF